MRSCAGCLGLAAMIVLLFFAWPLALFGVVVWAILVTLKGSR